MKCLDYVRFGCSDFPQCRTYIKSLNIEFGTMTDDLISNDLDIEHFINVV